MTTIRLIFMTASCVFGGCAAFRAVSLWLTGKCFFPRGYASALIPDLQQPRVEAQPRTNNGVFGKPEAYRTESGAAANRLMKQSGKSFVQTLAQTLNGAQASLPASLTQKAS